MCTLDSKIKTKVIIEYKGILSISPKHFRFQKFNKLKSFLKIYIWISKESSLIYIHWKGGALCLQRKNTTNFESINSKIKYRNGKAKYTWVKTRTIQSYLWTFYNNLAKYDSMYIVNLESIGIWTQITMKFKINDLLAKIVSG